MPPRLDPVSKGVEAKTSYDQQAGEAPLGTLLLYMHVCMVAYLVKPALRMGNYDSMLTTGEEAQEYH